MVRYHLKLLGQDSYLKAITLVTLAVYLTICMVVSAADRQGAVVAEVFTNRYYWFFCFFSVDLSAIYILAKRENVILALRAGCMKCELVYQVATLNIFMLAVLGVHLAITVLIPPLMEVLKKVKGDGSSCIALFLGFHTQSWNECPTLRGGFWERRGKEICFWDCSLS